MSPIPETNEAWMRAEVVAATPTLFDLGDRVSRPREPVCDLETHRLSMAFLRRLRAGERIERIVGDHAPEYADHLKRHGIEVQVKSFPEGLAWAIVSDSGEVD